MEAPPSDDHKDLAAQRPIDVDTDADERGDATDDNNKRHRQSPGSSEPPIKKQRVAIFFCSRGLLLRPAGGNFSGDYAFGVQQCDEAKEGDKRAGYPHHQRACADGLHGRPHQLRCIPGPQRPSRGIFQEGDSRREEAAPRGPAEGILISS
eukprot:8418197-Pyramimonas_sp.AAC.1